MLNFSYASVFMAMITTNLFIIILTIIFFNENILYKFGFSLMEVFCILIIIRMLFPFELKNITIPIILPAFLSKVLSFMGHHRALPIGYNYTIWEICLFIWSIVFIILFLRYFYIVKGTYSLIQNYGTDVTNNYSFYVNNICCNKKLCKKISIIKLPLISSPAVFRYHLHYYILLPDKLILNEEELELIFKHEISHITHHDLTLKFLLRVLCLFYWWNPFCKILTKQSNLLFELRVDSSVIADGDTERYMACLIKVMEESTKNKSILPSTISLSLKNSSAIHKRFYFLINGKETKSWFLTKFILLPICIIYLVSFIFIFESYYMPPQHTISGKSISSDNVYIIQNKNNKYDIYFNGKYAETVESLEYYPKDCKIYSSLEEAKKCQLPIP